MPLLFVAVIVSVSVPKLAIFPLSVAITKEAPVVAERVTYPRSALVPEMEYVSGQFVVSEVVKSGCVDVNGSPVASML